MGKMVYKLAKKVGTYTNQNGEEKSRWMNCGIVIQSDNGNLSLKLESLPVGMASEDGEAGIWFSLFPHDPNEQRQGGGRRPKDAFGHGIPPQGMPQVPQAMPAGGQVPTQQAAVKGAFEDDDIPF